MMHCFSTHQPSAIAKRFSLLLMACALIILNMSAMQAAIAQPPLAREVPIFGPQRQQPVRQIVIHTTGGPDCQAARSFRSGTLDGIVEYFRRNQKRISIHYIIGRAGEMVRMVPESRVAFHVRGHNADSIGIELINHGDGRDPFSEPQISALIGLLRDLLARYHLQPTALKAHSELDRSELTCGARRLKRKVDPGAAFPWARIRAALLIK